MAKTTSVVLAALVLFAAALAVAGLQRDAVSGGRREALFVKQQQQQLVTAAKKSSTCYRGCNVTADWTCKSSNTALVLSITLGFYGLDRFYYGYIFIGLIKLLVGLFAVCFPVCHLAILGYKFMPTFDPINGKPKGMCSAAVKMIYPEGEGSRSRAVWIVDPYAYGRCAGRLWCTCTSLAFIAWLIYDIVSISSKTLLPAANPLCLV